MILAAAPVQAQPLGVLAIVLAGVAVLMLLIRMLGLFLERTHLEQAPAVAGVKKEAPAAAPASIEAMVPGVRDPELVAVLAAATAVVIGKPYRIVAVSEPKTPSVESLMQVWSWEGRRQIYSSHRVR